ncbi:MAG TPA: PepSY domain-containing protein [Thermoanaerobaculia bacterium]|nr:PepSY domain-containing protein [Thermoanaerobaculia bacterium]
MDFATRRSVISALFCALALVGAPGHAAEESKAADETGFSGRWALAKTRDSVVLKSKATGWGLSPGAGDGPGGVGGGSAGGGFDLPLEVMTDARRLVVVDDGTTLRVTYPTGRKRTFVTDGATRYIDDGDGPGDVTARRKGTMVTVASEWSRGYKLRETWELRASPRSLVVTGKVKGRESQEYVRAYEPAPPGDPVLPTPAPGASSSPSAAVGGEEVSPVAHGAESEAAPSAVDRLGECTIRPPRNASSEELNRLARISQEEARKTAVASLAPLKPGDVISSDVEPFEGCLVWSFTLRLPGKKGVQEVFVDAGDGKVVWSEFVPMGPSPDAAPVP